MARPKALFLDRDGIINVDHGYVHLSEQFEFLPGIFELCRAARELDYRLVVVTNQAGVARGYYSEDEFLELTRWMMARFVDEQVHVTRLYYCPYHPELGVGKYKYDSPDRKPNPGMLLRAQSELNLDLPSSILIGDKASDIQAGVAAGVGTLILLPRTEDEISGDSCHVVRSLDEIRQRFFSHSNSPTSSDGFRKIENFRTSGEVLDH